MLAEEMRNISKISRQTNDEFQKQWQKMIDIIKDNANKGYNKCPMVYGKYNEQLKAKLKENGFEVKMACDIFPNLHYGMRNSATLYVVW